jgi:hypothetical protein
MTDSTFSTCCWRGCLCRQSQHVEEPILIRFRISHVPHYTTREELLRIYYFVDRKTERMVLLNCITKPDGHNFSSKYQGNAGKKLERELQESIALAVTLKAEYSSTNPAYEPFPKLTL